MSEKVWIGYAEYVSLPAWGVRRLRVKVDTGARTSALHVEDLRTIGDHSVRFRVLGHKGDPDVLVKAPVLRRSRIRSSNGQEEERFIVVTTLRLGPVEKSIELSLTRRGEMRYPMLLGRSALAGDFLIDPSRRGLTSKKKAKKKQAKKKTAVKRAVAKKAVAKKKAAAKKSAVKKKKAIAKKKTVAKKKKPKRKIA